MQRLFGPSNTGQIVATMRADDTLASRDEDDPELPLSLDAFTLKVQELLGLDEISDPGARLREDLNLDDFAIFQLGLRFNQLLGQAATPGTAAFPEFGSVRQLYLHYLTIISMPGESLSGNA
jgi:hypothetical protein